MRKEVSPALVAVIIGLVVVAGVLMFWKSAQNQDAMPRNANAGPIVLPPSQQGRILPGGTLSAPISNGQSSR